jgi:hypothetical protein
MTTKKLTELQERVARLAAALPGISKAELARRAHCSRRAVITHFNIPAFIQRVKDLQAERSVDELEIVASLDKGEKDDLLKRLRQKRGTYLPELEELEDELKGEDHNPPDPAVIRSVILGLLQINNDFSGPELSIEELDRMVAEKEAKLAAAGVDISPRNPELQIPPYCSDIGSSDFKKSSSGFKGGIEGDRPDDHELYPEYK